MRFVGLTISFVIICATTLVLLAFYITTSSGQQRFKKTCPFLYCEQILKTAYDVRSNLDFSNIISSPRIEKNTTAVNIRVSRNDIKEFNDVVRKGIKQTFHRDEWKEWRSIKIDFGSERNLSANAKLHGTSTGPIERNGVTFFDTLYSKVFQTGEPYFTDKALSDLKISLKVKLNKKKYYDGIRRFVFLTDADDWDSTSIALTDVALDLGLITSKQSLTHVFFNGYDAGIYLTYEDFGKELLERHFGITSYGILKTNDVWDKSLNVAHSSQTDFFIQDKETAGDSTAASIGLSKLEELFTAANKKDVSIIKRLVNLDDLAKISALQLIYGTNHSTTGDNLKYVYNLADGKFRFIFRAEGGAYTPGGTNITNIDDKIQYYPQENIILKALIEDKDFLRLRAVYLKDIVDYSEQIIENSLGYIRKIRQLGRSTSKDVRQKINMSLESHANLKKNLGLVSQYLDHLEVYVTHNVADSELTILNNSAQPLLINAIQTCDGTFQNLPETFVLSPSFYRPQFLQISRLDIPSDVSCVKNLQLHDGTTVPEFDFFINQNTPVKSNLINETEFSELFNGNVLVTGTQWTVLSGVYHIKEDTSLPYDINLKIAPGVTFLLHPTVTFLIRGGLTAEGTMEKQISIKAFNPQKPFGSFAVLGSNKRPSIVKLDYFQLVGGREDTYDGVYFSGQMSIHHGKVEISNSKFLDSFSDDGLNIKFSEVDIKSSTFSQNSGDQFDCDFCKGRIYSNLFEGPSSSKTSLDGSDGLDVSGSIIEILNNNFSGFTDKGISVGEISDVIIKDNLIENSATGIAVKDGSLARLSENEFSGNNENVTSYIKKKMYGEPKIFQ